MRTDLSNINTADYADPGEVPVLDWIDKSLIDADPLYQRPLDAGRVDTILRGFTWRSFGALVVVPQAGGRYHATDGQHRLEAAKLHPKVQHVPAVIVKAEDISSEASIFVEINKNRKNVSPLELFFAQLAAGDDDALTVQQVCERAGVRIPKYPGNFRPGDSVAVTALCSLVGNVGAMRAREYLQALVGAGFSPIKAEHIKAVQHIMTDPEFADQVAIDDLAVAVKTVGAAGDVEAKRFAATHCTSVWKGLASVWFQKCKKRRAATGLAKNPVGNESSGPPATRAFNESVGSGKAHTFRTAVPHAIATDRVVTGAIMGDPPKGRSALDLARGSSQFQRGDA